MASQADVPHGRDPAVSTSASNTWEYAYMAVLPVLDAFVVTVAAYVALRQRFGDADPAIGPTTYSVLVALAAPLWVLVVALSRGYEARFLGVGSEEFKRVCNGSVRFAALVASLSYALHVDVARGFVAIALPLGTLGLLVGRYAARRVVHALRLHGRCLHRTVVVGTRPEVRALVDAVAGERWAGLIVVGACVPGAGRRIESDAGDVPVLGPPDDVAHAVAELRADTVAIAGSRAVDSDQVRRIAWQLEGTGVDLLVVPALTDVAGPRIHVRPVAGLPLLHVEAPAFSGVRRLTKAALDRVLGGALLLLLAPVFVAVALAVKLDDGGPVFFRQERTGLGGRPFRLWKFRSMRVDADALVAELAPLNEQDAVLFKIRRDPRVTRVGRFLRRYSLDELPQLFNVLAGRMSLVGPRPPLPCEVAGYADDVHRRLLVKPGMTGLWQVSGRSDLAWSESLRLDLYYVENWSPALDLMILWKTCFAVVAGRGAY